MSFTIGQKIKHIEYGTRGTFLGINENNQFNVILDNQDLPLDPIPISFIKEWE